jgi:hypothetical protein
MYQHDRNVPFDCKRKLVKNRPVRHKGRRKSGTVQPAPKGESVLAWDKCSREKGAPQLGFYSEIQAIFDELSWLARMTFSHLFASQPSARGQ